MNSGISSYSNRSEGPFSAASTEQTKTAPKLFQTLSGIISRKTDSKSSPRSSTEIKSNSSTTSSPALRRQATNGTPTSVALNLLRQASGKYTAFNSIADTLKKDSDWKSTITNELKKLPLDSFLQLIDNLDELQMRGFDKEVLLQVVSDVIILAGRLSKSVDPSQIEKLHKMKESMDVLVRTLPEIPPDSPQEKSGADGIHVKGEQGGVNTVYPVTYQGKKYMFKPDPSQLGALTKIKEQHFGTATASGIPAGDDAHLPSRAVASSLVDRLLFPNGNIAVNTQFAVINGQRGILMDRAQGASPKITGTEQRTLARSEYIHLVDNDPPTPKELKRIAGMLKLRDVTIETGPRGRWGLIGTAATFEGLNPRNAQTAEGLLKLQVFDWITGQCDRHPGNYFIANDGNVTAIDNDCSFGVNAVPEGVEDIRGQSSLKGFIPNNASLMLRLPPAITPDVKKSVNNLHVTKNELVEALKGHISENEIAATISRLDKLHAHINSDIECLAVESAEELLSPEAQKVTDTNNSYLARELVVYSQDEKGWNHLRAARLM